MNTETRSGNTIIRDQLHRIKTDLAKIESEVNYLSMMFTNPNLTNASMSLLNAQTQLTLAREFYPEH